MQNTISLKTDKLELEVAKDFGPRILSLKTPTSPNLLAELPNSEIPTLYGTYYLRGGHRFWHAPESMPRTYMPDNEPPQISEIANGLHIVQPIEIQTGIQKEMRITLTADSVKIDHTLSNHGLWAIELAPWALTMMAPGGTAVFPETNRRSDPSGLLPNRHLVLWSYSQLSDPRLKFEEHLILVNADPTIKKAVKFGYANTTGWQGYYRADLRVWFIKIYQHNEKALYPDMGCSTECYCCDEFIELETLGPITKLEPGASLVHSEAWYVWADRDFEDLAHLV